MPIIQAVQFFSSMLFLASIPTLIWGDLQAGFWMLTIGAGLMIGFK